MGNSHQTRLPGPATAPGAVQLGLMKPTRQSTGQTSLSTVGTMPLNEKTYSDRPWKYEGYPEFSKLMASDDDVFVFRRFATVNARVILWMQHQITRKERRLEEIDNFVEQSPLDASGRNDSFEWDEKSLEERDRLMRELSALVMHYNKYVDAFSKMRSRPAAEPRQIQNVRNWLTDNEGNYRDAISEPETAPYTEPRYAADLISISPRTRPPLGQWLESSTRLQVSRLFREKPVEGRHMNATTSIYSSNAKFEKLTNRSIIFGGLIMLLTPLWLLEYYSGSKIRLGIITAFVVAFMVIMSTATINRPFEVVASSAAYAAVLMVFMQINTS